MKILIDTDLGDDLDDAFALMSAMCLDLEVIGVTTVFRDTRSRARMAKKLLRDFGYTDTPVYPGWSEYAPQPENHENVCLFGPELNAPEYEPEGNDPDDAVDFIIESCRRWGKELTVIAIGPFCNLAKVIEKDPQALALVGKVCIMGGAYFKQYADWNVMCDVPAAEVMFRSLPNLHCIGADVTHLLYADNTLLNALNSGAMGYLSTLYREWRQRDPNGPFLLHDVLAIYYALDPSICAMESIHVQLITQGPAKGLTLNVEGYSKAWLNEFYRELPENPPVWAAKTVDLEQFTRLFHRDIAHYINEFAKGNEHHG